MLTLCESELYLLNLKRVMTRYNKNYFCQTVFYQISSKRIMGDPFKIINVFKIGLVMIC